MASLDELRRKWFIEINSSPAFFPPRERHPGSTVSDYTDGNQVTPLIDGQDYMRVWHDLMRTMASESCSVYHTGWRLEGVRTLGHTVPASNALDVIDAADEDEANVYITLSRHGFNAFSIFNRLSVEQLQLRGVSGATLDNRYPAGGSNHQKAVWFHDGDNINAIMGSIDISRTRWDRHTHSDTDPLRDPTFGAPTHDLGVRIEGPATADIERSFLDRWNDSTRTFGLEPVLVSQPILTPSTPPPNAGTHSVQVLHTYGRTNVVFGYSWHELGDFTIWAAYINALLRAETYIYIEDQYFLPFGWPMCHTRRGRARDTDIIYQLGEAIRRGVRVIAVVPSNAEDALHVYQQFQRDQGVIYLQGIAATSTGDFVIATLHNGTSAIYVHSKLLICDDEYVLMGSANVGQRSMAHDGELDIGIVDEAEEFARELRKALWSEHLQVPADSLDDFETAYELFQESVTNNETRLRPYDLGTGGMPHGHEQIINELIDPYAGPPR